jgi:hypothetical protein
MILFACSLYFTYTHTRDAYRALGFNDGQIHQGEQLMREIERSTQVGVCDHYDKARTKQTALLSVKDESVYVIPADDGSVRFCRPPH